MMRKRTRRKPSIVARALKAMQRLLLGERAAPPDGRELAERLGGCLPARAIAEKIGVSHQTVGRARESLKGESANARSKRPGDGPRGPSSSGGSR